MSNCIHAVFMPFLIRFLVIFVECFWIVFQVWNTWRTRGDRTFGDFSYLQTLDLLKSGKKSNTKNYKYGCRGKAKCTRLKDIRFCDTNAVSSRTVGAYVLRATQALGRNEHPAKKKLYMKNIPFRWYFSLYARFSLSTVCSWKSVYLLAVFHSSHHSFSLWVSKWDLRFQNDCRLKAM